MGGEGQGGMKNTGGLGAGGNCEFGSGVVVSLNLPQSSNPHGRCITWGLKVCVEPKRDFA